MHNPEACVFSHEGREFTVQIDEDGALRVFITGKRNGKMLIEPQSNNFVIIRTEKPGVTPSKTRER